MTVKKDYEKAEKARVTFQHSLSMKLKLSRKKKLQLCAYIADETNGNAGAISDRLTKAYLTPEQVKAMEEFFKEN